VAEARRSYRPHGYGPHGDARSRPPWRRGLPAPYVLPAGFAALLAVGTVAAALHGRLDSTGVLICCAVVVGALSPVAEPTAAAPLGLIAWLTVVGFSRPPYADLRLTGAVSERAAVTLALSALRNMLGATSATNSPMITTTTSISISVTPAWPFRLLR